MAVVWVHEIMQSPATQKSIGEGTSYTRRFEVLVDSLEDGPSVVYAAVDPTTGLSIPQPFEQFEFGTDSDTSSVCRDVDADRNKNAPLLWEVEAQYRYQAGASDSGGGQIELTAYLPSWRTWFVPRNVVVDKARRGKPENGDDFTYVMGTNPIDVLNRAGQPYQHALEEEEYDKAFEIRRNEWFYYSTIADNYMNRVNEDTFWGRPPGEVRMVHIGGAQATAEETVFAVVTYEFHIRPGGWAETLLNQGFMRPCNDSGAVITTWSSATGWCQIEDKIGVPVSRPVLLDANGFDVLAPNSDAIYDDWYIKDQATFADLNLPTPLSLGIVV